MYHLLARSLLQDLCSVSGVTWHLPCLKHGIEKNASFSTTELQAKADLTRTSLKGNPKECVSSPFIAMYRLNEFHENAPKIFSDL